MHPNTPLQLPRAASAPSDSPILKTPSSASAAPTPRPRRRHWSGHPHCSSHCIPASPAASAASATSSSLSSSPASAAIVAPRRPAPPARSRSTPRPRPASCSASSRRWPSRAGADPRTHRFSQAHGSRARAALSPATRHQAGDALYRYVGPQASYGSTARRSSAPEAEGRAGPVQGPRGLSRARSRLDRRPDDGGPRQVPK